MPPTIAYWRGLIDTAEERSPKLHKVIEPEEIVEKTNLSAPHTVHCLPGRA